MQEIVSTRLSPKEFFEFDQFRKTTGKSSTDILKPLIHDYLIKQRALKMQESQQTQFKRGLQMLFDPNKNFDRELFRFSKDAEKKVSSYAAAILRGEVYIPYTQRDLAITGGTGAGVEIAPTIQREDLTALQYDNVFQNLGVIVEVEESASTVNVPSITGSSAYIESTEGAGVSESTATTGEFNLTPLLANVTTQRSRIFQNNISNAAARILEVELKNSLMEKIGNMLFHGSGSDGEPTGLFENATAITQDCSSFGLTKALAMVKASDDNKFSFNRKWVMSPDVFQTLSERQIVDSRKMIEMHNGTFYMGNYPVVVTNCLDSGSLAFGNWSNALVVLFGAAMALSYKQSASNGLITVFADSFFNIAIQNAANFVISEASTFS